MDNYQSFGLGVVIVICAIVIGYIASQFVPRKHYPRTAGLLVFMVVIAGLAWYGSAAAGTLMLWLAVGAVCVPFLIFGIFGAAWDKDSEDMKKSDRKKFRAR